MGGQVIDRRIIKYIPTTQQPQTSGYFYVQNPKIERGRTYP